MSGLPDEFALISRLTRGLATSERTVLGVGDDCAILRGSGGSDLLLTSDMLIEGVHFRRDTMPWPAVGAKALTCGLSDVAAMGGTAKWATVSLGLPADFAPDDADALYQGLADQARRFNVDIVGGDTVQSPARMVIDVVVLGAVDIGLALRRSAARDGEAIVVTGRLGDAAAGLDILLSGEADDDSARRLIAAHQWPVPRSAVGAKLPYLGTVGACIDVSDGLVGDLRHVCEAAGLGAVVYEEHIPMSDAMTARARARRRDPLDWALGGGEDYELLFTMPQRAAEVLLAQWNTSEQVPLTVIGAMQAGAPEVQLRRRSGVLEPVTARGYTHFGSDGT